jgi:predicted anti-sigma-YlaC factor YlaD
VRCPDCRESLSARLDGEDDPGERAAVDAHLTRCAECRAWQDRAARVTRLARTGLVEPVPDLADAVLVAAPPPRRVRWQLGLRGALAALGVGQLGLAIGGVLAAAHSADARGHGGAGLGGATLAHFSHESAAWNLALAVGFLWVAARAGRAAALVPVIGTFVVVLGGLSLLDLLRGSVETSRLASHVVVLLGLLVLLVLARLGDRPGDGTPTAITDVRVRLGRDDAPAWGERWAAPAAGRHQDGLEPTARRHAA